jgi:fumarate hydratase class II
MTDQPPEQPKVVAQRQRPCGCLEIDLDNKQTIYRPCLSDALMNAGNMLAEAANRIREASVARLQAEEARLNADLRRKMGL